jgi:hypothetical protein
MSTRSSKIERRGISKQWIEETLENPDEIETQGRRRSFLKRLPRRQVMPCVVTPLHEPDYVITAYFDRTKPCE